MSEQNETQNNEPQGSPHVAEKESAGQLTIVKSLGRLLYYSIIAVALFIFTALSIFILRNPESEKINMPDLVGKYYIDVHNELSQSRLHVIMRKRRFLDQPPGIVLHQSIQPGAFAHSGETLYVVVNQPEPIVTMPDLKGTSLQASRSILERINYNDETYSLEIGAITYIPSATVPANTVLEQFPPSGTEMKVQDKVYLVVSVQTGRGMTGINRPEDMVGQNITLAQTYFNKMEKDYKIAELIKPKDPSLIGTIKAVERVKGDREMYHLTVYYRSSQARFQNGYEMLEIDSREGECRVWEDDGEERFTDRDRILYQTSHAAAGQKMRVIYYRQGSSLVKASCGDRVVFDQTLNPDSFG